MSKNILQQLFDGEVYPSENLCVGVPEYHTLIKALSDEKEIFLKTLNGSNLDLFKKIEDLYHQMIELYSYESFVNGYRLGAMLLFEALKSTDTSEQNTGE